MGSVVVQCNGSAGWDKRKGEKPVDKGDGAGLDVRACDCVPKFVSQRPLGAGCRSGELRTTKTRARVVGGSLSTTAASVVLFECEHIFVAEERTLVTRESTIAYLSLASIVSLNART